MFLASHTIPPTEVAHMAQLIPIPVQDIPGESIKGLLGERLEHREQRLFFSASEKMYGQMTSLTW